jgi:DNA-binding GntR family transcriptional regulator
MRQSEAAYLRLREDIVTLVMSPGDPLSESATAARLGISRTPVREAIRQLAQENLVTVIPDRGAFVAPVSLTDVGELFQLRQALEPFAYQLASITPDTARLEELLAEFDGAVAMIESDATEEYIQLCTRMDQDIVRMNRNRRLISALQSIWNQFQRIRMIAKANPHRLLATVDENRSILEAVASKDGEKAAALKREQLQRALENILVSFRVPL